MSTFSANKIVVWERLSKLGKWVPYPANIAQLLEECRTKKIQNVCLGDVEKALKIYSVDIIEMMQVSEATGTKSPVRRSLYDNLSVLGRGFSWQWYDDNDNWNSYDVDVNNYIDAAFLEGRKSVSLARAFPGYKYEIDFLKMIQVNKHSKKKRKVRRQANASPYPTESKSEKIVNGDENKEKCDVEGEVLSPEYLAKDIPGTAALMSQVNAYKRNVESPEYIMNFAMDATSSGAISGASNQAHISNNEVKQSSSNDTTVALVNGKPWFDSRPPHTAQSQIKPVPGIEPLPKPEKPKKQKRKGAKASCPEDPSNVLETYTEVVDSSSFASDHSCIICCETLSSASSYNGDTTVSKLTLCSHMFHKACLEAMYNSGNKEFLQCPSCKKIHGEKCGIQPPGEMVYHVLPYSLPSYSDCDTIRIIYNIPSGTQGPNHPNPGHYYSARGFPRHCYLPDNEMGRKILRLLIKAWKRRLIFTIGRSSTTGEEDTVTWNEIHHKTEFGYNRRGHGYPDPNYFSNVMSELEAHGIIDDEVKVWYPA